MSFKVKILDQESLKKFQEFDRQSLVDILHISFKGEECIVEFESDFTEDFLNGMMMGAGVESLGVF